MCQPEPASDQACAWEYRFDFLRYRIGGDIEVLGHLAHEQIAHAPPHDIGLVTFFLEATDDLGCVRTQLPDRDTVFGEWNDDVLCDDEFLTKNIFTGPTAFRG
jgi:hypothetical protein